MPFNFNWVPQAIIDALRGDYQAAVFLNVAVPGDPLRLCMTFNSIPIGFNAIDPNGVIYQGGCTLLNVSPIEILYLGTSDTLDIQLSGVNVETGASIIDELLARQSQMRGAATYIGFTCLDVYWQPITEIWPLVCSKYSHPYEGIPPTPSDQSWAMNLGVVVTSGDNTRSIPAQLTWTGPSHKRGFPTDLGCDNTSAYARGVYPVWPRF